MRSSSRGFTLMELMVILAIIGALAAAALPSYQSYLQRGAFTEVTLATAPYKLGVETCFATTGKLDDCASGNNGIPAAISGGKGTVASLAAAAGVITATAGDVKGLGGTTYVLTPTATDGRLNWAVTGTCVDKDLCPGAK